MPRPDEIWVPRCPRCGNGNILLARANQYSRNVLPLVEVYCSECQWLAKLEDVIKTLWIRL